MKTEILIRPSRDIRTKYADISRLCRKQPVAVTVNGKEDTVLLSHEYFNEMLSELNSQRERLEVYSILASSAEDMKNGRTFAEDSVFDEIVSGLKK